MRALITYQGGKSTWYGKYRFFLDKPVPVTDPKVIEHCKNTVGFSVTIVEAKPKKIIRPVVKTAVEKTEATATPRKKLGKKKPRR